MSPASPTFSGTLSLTGADAASFNLSSATLPSNLRTTGSLADGSYGINIVATQGGAIGSPFTQPVTVVGGGALQLTRTVNNGGTGAMPAAAFWTVGHPFSAGEVPSGSIVTAALGGTAVPVQGIAYNTHSDGSLRWAQLLLDLSGVAITAGASKDLVLTPVAGSWSTTTSRTDADWAALVDTVEITSLSTTSSGAPSPDLDGAGTWTAAFDAGASNVIDVYGQGPLGYWVTVIAPFKNGATTHRFLYAMMEYWVCQKTDTSLGPVASRGPIICNDYAFKTAPGSFNFDLAYKRGGSTIRSDGNVRVLALSKGVLSSLDASWEWSANDPQVWVSQDYTKLRKAFPAIPFRDGITYIGNENSQPTTTITGINTSTGVVTVTPSIGSLASTYVAGTCAAVDFIATSMPTGLTAGVKYWAAFLSVTTFQIYDTYGHALAGGATGKVIPSTSGSVVEVRVCLAPVTIGPMTGGMGQAGSRNDISLMTEWTAAYIVANTRAHQRLGRTVAFILLDCPILVRNDKTNKIPSLLDASGTPAGMIGAGQTGDTFKETRWSITIVYSSDINGGVQPPGGNNFWVPQNSHMPSPAFLVWLLEGGSLLRDFLYAFANNMLGSQAYTVRNFHITPISTTYYGSMANQNSLRENAWAVRDMANAAFAAPDSSDEQTYFRTMATNTVAAQVAYEAYQGTNYSNLGIQQYYENDYPPSTHTSFGQGADAFTPAYLCAGYAWASLLIGDFISGMNGRADFAARGLNNMVNLNCAYWITTYIQGYNLSQTGDPSPVNIIADVSDVGFSNDVNFITYVNGSADILSEAPVPWTLTVGDKFRPTNWPGIAIAPPAPLVGGTDYFVVATNVGGNANKFRISATSGGSPITITGASSSTQSRGFFLPTAQSCPASGDNGGTAADPNGYLAYWTSAAALQTLRGGTGASAAFTELNGRLTASFNGTCMWGFQDTL